MSRVVPAAVFVLMWGCCKETDSSSVQGRTKIADVLTMMEAVKEFQSL